MKIRKVVIIVVSFVIIAFLGMFWFTKEALGTHGMQPKIIPINEKKYLFCKQSYSSDFANVAYVVSFTLKEDNKKDFYIGTTTFLNEDWEENVKYREYDSCIVIALENYSNVRFFIKEKNGKFAIDTIFSSENLRRDSLWYNIHKEIPDWAYSNNTFLDEIIDSSFVIEYEYRVTEGEISNFYKQNVEYVLNPRNGLIKTTQVFEREKFQPK